MIAFVWADNDGAEPVMELCAAPASGIYLLKLSVGGEGGQKYTLTYMFVMLGECLRDVCGRGNRRTNVSALREATPSWGQREDEPSRRHQNPQHKRRLVFAQTKEVCVAGRVPPAPRFFFLSPD